MKKIICISLIIMSIFITGCSSSDNKKENKKLDLSEAILTYEYCNCAWGKIYYAYIINGYGDVKKIDSSEENKNIWQGNSFQEIMKNPEIPIFINVGKIPGEILDKIKQISDVKLKWEVVAKDGGSRDYFCALGNNTGKMILIQELGNSEGITKDKNVKAVCKYID